MTWKRGSQERPALCRLPGPLFSTPGNLQRFLFVLAHSFWGWTEPASLCVPPPPLAQRFPKPLLSGTSCAVCWGASLLPGSAAALPRPSAGSRLNHCPARFPPIPLITRAGCHSPTSSLGTFVSSVVPSPLASLEAVCDKLSLWEY